MADNGEGIPEANIAHLFEPFYTTKEQGKGTGLGLAMVFGAIKTHRGHIEVSSEPGKGATFTLYFPLLETGDAVQNKADHEGIYPGNGQTILLVDDERSILTVGKELLESLGYRVITASDGADAVDVFAAHQQEIALVITDMVMPHLSGSAAVAKMRQLQPALKVLFATGYDKKPSSADIQLSGKETILFKPFRINALSKTIHDKLSE